MARNRRPQDSFGHKAKKEGFAARSIYKLEEIDRRVQLLARGNRVLDLGAYPGSWMQYAASKVGKEGRVLGLDQQPNPPGVTSNTEFRQCDVLQVTPEELGGPGTFDVVLSDMAPWTSGARFVDQCRSFELFMHALAIAEGTLKLNGHFVGKIFQGPDFDKAKKRVHEKFSSVRVLKPEASRKESIEIFVVGLGFKG